MSDKLKNELLEKQIAFEKESKTDRHNLVNKMSTITFDLHDKMDKQEKVIFGLQKDSEYMRKEFDEHRQETKDGFKEIKNLIIGQGKTYATKKEHEENSKKIKGLYKIWIFIGTPFALALLGAIIKLIINQG